MATNDCIYHRKQKKPTKPHLERCQTFLNEINDRTNAPESQKLNTPVHSLTVQRFPNRNHADDFKSQLRIDWGLPNHLLGYNKTSKQRFDGDVELKRRNVELMDSFETVNESVAKLLALLSMETAPGLPQVPDRTRCGGQPFTIQNYIDVNCKPRV